MEPLSQVPIWVSNDAHLGPRLLIAPPPSPPLSRWQRFRLWLWMPYARLKGLIRARLLT